MEIIKLTNLAEQTQNVISILNKFNKESYLLVLSGGHTPTGLYKYLSHSFNYTFPSDVALTDERWQRQKFHENSNELMIKNTGLLGRMEWEKAGWHPILTEKTTPTEESLRYSIEMDMLFQKYGQNMIAILGMNTDGHICGILSDSPAQTATETVTYFESNDQYQDRITLTFSAIKQYFHNVVLLLENKNKIAIFENLLANETDSHKYSVLALKDLPNVTVLGIDQD